LNSKVSTSGSFLTEAQLRMYVKCSKLYQFGETVELDSTTRACKASLEVLAVKALKKTVYDPMKDLQYAVLRSVAPIGQNEALLEPQIQKMISTSYIWLNDFFELFPLSTYFPVHGPCTLTVKISKTPIKLNISGLFRTKRNATMHAVTFCPYTSRHSVFNDPVNLLKVKVLEPYIKRHIASNRPNVNLHIFGLTAEGKLVHNSIDSNFSQKSTYRSILQTVKNIEEDNCYPVIPCPWSCQYKTACFGGKNE